MVFVLSYHVLFSLFCFYIIEACSFLMRNGKGVDLDGKEGEECEGVEEGKTILRMYNMRKESLLNERESTFSKVTCE